MRYRTKNKNSRYITFILVLSFLYIQPVNADPISSENYVIGSKVISGGGLRGDSSDYIKKSTIAQSSPIGKSSSSDYNNYAGFRYTVQNSSNLFINYVGTTSSVNINQNITHELEIGNSGPGRGTNLEMTYVLPLNVTYIDGSGNGWSCSESNQTVTCTRSSLLINAVSNISIVVNASSEGILNNTFTINSNINDPYPGNNSINKNITVNPISDISVTMVDAPSQIQVGEYLSYIINITNNGPSNATGVTLTDNLPSSTAFISAALDQGSCNNLNNTISCSIGSIPAGSSTGVTITVEPISEEMISNTVNVISTESDPDTSNNTAAMNTTVYGPDMIMGAGWKLLGWTSEIGYYSGTEPLQEEYAVGGTLENVEDIKDVLVSIGLTPSNYSVMAGPDGKVYVPESPFNTLDSLLPGRAYWIYLEEDTTISMPGNTLDISSSYSFQAGWVLTGFWGEEGNTPSDSFRCIDGLYDAIVDGSGNLYIPGSIYNTLSSINQTDGYFMYAAEPGTLTYDCQ